MALLQHHYRGQAAIATLEIDQPKDRSEAARLSERVHLHYTPTFLVVDTRGLPVAEFVGPTSYAALAGALDRAMQPPRP